MGCSKHTSFSLVTWRIFAILAYPALVMVALWLDEPRLRALGMPLLALSVVGPGPIGSRWLAVMSGAVVLAAAVVLAPAFALWPPGLICMLVGAWFGLSLRAGQTPIIERFAVAVHEILDSERPTDSDRWMWGWTLVWSLMLGALGAVALVLAAADRAGIWLVWVIGVIPAAMATCLLTEFWWRRRRFVDHAHWPLGQFVSALASIRPEQMSR